MKYISTILTLIITLILTVSCQQDALEGNETPKHQEIADRQLTEIKMEASIENGKQRMVYERDNESLNLSWEENELLGVYIKQENGEIVRAGSLVGKGTAGETSRVFKGSAYKLESGESYIYMYPDISNGTAIDFTQQKGALGSTDHLKKYVPLIWRSNDGRTVTGAMENQGYVIHLNMQFKENPGSIKSITIKTMKRGSNGTTVDRIFPKKFNTDNLGEDINAILPSPNTDGTTLGEDYTDQLTLTVTDGVAVENPSTHFWEAEAYIACARVENLNVFYSKFYAEVQTADGSTYYCDIKSFPGQSSIGQSDPKELNMIANGTQHNMTRNFSKDVSMTIINENYGGIFSLLGMWNEFGKSYDPYGLIVYQGGDAEMPAAGVLPQQLTDNKSGILTRYKNNGIGTPTFLGPVAPSLYATTATVLSNTKQDDVTVNNITITEATEVFVTFLSEYAWNQNLLGYYYYMGEAPVAPSTLTKYIVFPNVSKPKHEPFNLDYSTRPNKASENIGNSTDAPLQEFETVKLLYTDKDGFISTVFPAGTTLGFMMMIDPRAASAAEKDQQFLDNNFSLMNWNQWRLFTNSVWNANNENWLNTYTNSNFFCSGDVSKGTDGATPIPGLAIYGVKDNAINTANTAYGAMIFMVSTSKPNALQTQNKAYFNIGTGNIVISK